MSRALTIALAGIAGVVTACGAPPPQPAARPGSAMAATERQPTSPERPLEPPVESGLPPLARDRLLATADGVVVFEVEQMRRFDIRPLARAFVLETVEIDLLEVEKICGLVPTEVVDRLIVSGSLHSHRLLAALELSVPAARMLDCLGKVHPQARARELEGHPALELGHEQLWVTERNGVLLLAEEASLAEALGGEPRPPAPPMLDGVPIAEVAPGDVEAALPLVSRDPDRLIAVGHRGGEGGFLRLPTTSITFTFDGEALAVEGDIDLRGEERRQSSDRLKDELRREIAREMERATGDAAAAEPLLLAVDQARIEQRDGHLVFSGRSSALDVIVMLVNGVASREIQRELDQRALQRNREETAEPATPTDVSRGR